MGAGVGAHARARALITREHMRKCARAPARVRRCAGARVVPACLPACLRACMPACLPACLRGCVGGWVGGRAGGCVGGCVCVGVQVCGWVRACLIA